MTETFYDVLGVGTDATTAEIEAAYREQLKRTHPDVSDDDDAGERTQSLIEARDVLTDNDERERYDRVGHESYVGEDQIDSPTEAARDAARRSEPADDSDTGPRGPNRSRRERRASQRVSEERSAEQSGKTASAAEEQTEPTGSDSESASTAGPQWRDDTDERYNVRQEVTTERSYRDLLPSGRNATLLGIVFALYPVLLFSALIPAFPLFVNLLIVVCVLILVGYLQSMPSVALLVFGSWSLVTPLVLLALNISAFSLIGFAALCGTWLPFGFSILTASVLRL